MKKSSISTRVSNLGTSVLKLSIEKEEFEAILKGEKKVICCEITPENEQKLVQLDHENYAIEDENGNCIPVQYEVLHLYVDKKSGDDYALVRLESSYSQLLVDEDGAPIWYLLDPSKSEEEEGNQYFVEEVVYTLGEVLYHHNQEETMMHKDSSIVISKSSYKTFCQCKKMFWLQKKSPELAVDDPSAATRIETGHQVGDLAKGLFGKYTDVTTYNEDGSLNIAAMIEKTQQAIEAGADVICEAAFSINGNYCAVDILKREGDCYDIYEVKSSTGKDLVQYFPDVAFQWYTVESAGLMIGNVHLVYLNSEYVRGEELDIQELFAIEDVTEDVCGQKNDVGRKLDMARETLEGEEAPVVVLNKNCKGCPFFDHCTNHVFDEPSVFDLYRMHFDKKVAYYNAGKASLDKMVDEDYDEKQGLQIKCTLDNCALISPVEIKKFLDENISFPLYFLDFETMQPAIPEILGTKPYQQIPFQYSLHWIEKEGGELKHSEFLGVSGEDPMRAIAEQLCRDIPMDVCTTAYNKSFECTRLRELAVRFPDLADHLCNIADHIVDLIVPFQSFFYYEPAMRGSFSIKKVLPALFPDDPALDYHNLQGDVHNGTEAMNIFPKIKDMPVEDQVKARESLLRYCELDTFAMVKVWQKLKETANS